MKYDIIALVISALVLSGCVYPFDINTDSEGKAGGLVVEGDLLIGDVSTITLSTIQPLDGKILTPWFDASVWAEDDQGREYHASVKDPGTSFSLDLTDASIDRKYRMHIHMNRVAAGHSFDYSTPWLTVSKAPSFDGIDYVVGRDAGNRKPLDCRIIVIAEVLVSQLAVGCAYLKLVDALLDSLHPGLLCDSPGSGC